MRRIFDIILNGTITKISCYKNASNSGYYKADFDILLDGEECEAYFGIGPTSRILTINYPKPSIEMHYFLDYNH